MIKMNRQRFNIPLVTLGLFAPLCSFIVHLLFVTFHLSQMMMTVQGVFHKERSFFPP